jgi:hypothetical protein
MSTSFFHKSVYCPTINNRLMNKYTYMKYILCHFEGLCYKNFTAVNNIVVQYDSMFAIVINLQHSLIFTWKSQALRSHDQGS